MSRPEAPDSLPRGLPSFAAARQRFATRRRVEFLAVRKYLSEVIADDGVVAGLEAAAQLLETAGEGDPSVWTLPALICWNSLFAMLIARGTVDVLQAGHVHDEIRALNRVAAGVACRAGLSFESTVRLFPDGTVNFPTSRLCFMAGRDAGGRYAHISTHDGQLAAEVRSNGASGRAYRSGTSRRGFSHRVGWVRFPKIANTLFVDRDWALLSPRESGRKFAPMTPISLERWAGCLTAALELIAACSSELPVPAGQILRTVVPVVAPKGRMVSSSDHRAIGTILASLPSNPAYLAEMLVHEAAHSELNLLCEEVGFWRLGDPARAYRSPWRSDARPIGGVLHGIWAFYAVGSFWAAMLRRDTEPEFHGLARSRLRAVLQQLPMAIAQIEGSEELTGAGHLLLAFLKVRSAGLGEPATALSG